MSQSGELDVIANHPEIAIQYDADIGFAVPIGNTLNIVGAVAPADSDPVFTTGSGDTITINVQITQEIASTDVTKIGLAAFDSAGFDVDANGFVTLTGGGGAATNIDVDAFTPPGTDPVVPNAGNIVMTGAQVASGVVGANVLRTNSLAANTVTYEIQQSGSAVSENTTLNGVSHFNSAQFSVVNGFVSLLGGGQAMDSFTTDVSGPVAPSATGNVAFTGATNIFSDGSVLNTMRLNLQGTNHALFVGRGANTASANITTGNTGQLMQSAGAATDPGWTTSTYPATNAINTLLYASAANVMSALATGNNGVLITSATGVPSILANGTTGQIFTATTGSPPSWQAFPTRITTINGDTGSITGATVTIFANNTTGATGRSVRFTNSGTTSTLTLTDANDNILIGRVSGNATLTGLQNVAIGAGTLNALTSGSSNSVYGYSSGQSLTSGVQNAAYGRDSLTTCQTGNGNCAVGFESLKASTSSTGSNTAMGWRCLHQLVGGSTNTAYGIGAGANYTGSESSNIVIQNSGTLAESNTLRIGTQGASAGQVNRAFIAGIVGVTTSNTQMVTIDSTTGQLGVTTSVPIANGGTNATSFSTSNGMVKYDGTRLVTSTTATIDASDRIRNTAQPAFSAYSNTAVTNQTGDGTVYTVVFGTELFDNASNFDGTSTFTAPITGRYQFNISVLSQNNLVTHNPNIRLNCTGIAYTFGNWGGAFAGNMPLTGSIIIPMTAGDTATVQILTSNGTKTVGVYGAANDPRTIFSGFLVVA